MNITEQILSHYEKIVHALVAVAPEDWYLVKVGTKVFDDSIHITFGFFVGKQLKPKFMEIPRDDVRLLKQLFQELKRFSIARGEPWIGCRFQVDNKGKYDTRYFYEDLPLAKVVEG